MFVAMEALEASVKQLWAHIPRFTLVAFNRIKSTPFFCFPFQLHSLHSLTLRLFLLFFLVLFLSFDI